MKKKKKGSTIFHTEILVSLFVETKSLEFFILYYEQGSQMK